MVLPHRAGDSPAVTTGVDEVAHARVSTDTFTASIEGFIYPWFPAFDPATGNACSVGSERVLPLGNVITIPRGR